MTRIDSTRLSELFRTLGTNKRVSPEESQTPQKAINKDKLAPKRDKNVLKAHLSRRLKALKENSDRFEQEAPLVAIQEIMIWEFGDQFLNHPEFKHITQSIIATIEGSPRLSNHMQSMVENLSS